MELKVVCNNNLISIPCDMISITDLRYAFLYKYAFKYKDVLFLLRTTYFDFLLEDEDKDTFFYKVLKKSYKQKGINIKIPYKITFRALILDVYKCSYDYRSKKYLTKSINKILDKNYFSAIDNIIIEVGKKEFIFMDYSNTKNPLLKYIQDNDGIEIFIDSATRVEYQLLNGAVYTV